MNFLVLDKKEYDRYSGVKLSCCFPTTENDAAIPLREWICESKNKYLLVKYYGGMLTLGCAERFDDVRYNMSLVARHTKDGVKGIVKTGKISFEEIKEFMEWQIKEDQYID